MPEVCLRMRILGSATANFKGCSKHHLQQHAPITLGQPPARPTRQSESRVDCRRHCGMAIATATRDQVLFISYAFHSGWLYTTFDIYDL